MVFNDTSTKDGLIQDCEQLVFGDYGTISSNTNRLYDFTARINRALDKATTKILISDSRWQFDDTNHTDLPIGRANIVSGQSDYTLSVEHLELLNVRITDSQGNVKFLTPFDENDPTARSYIETPTTGTPLYYDKKGASLFLYPTPDYSYTNGLIASFQRGPSYFTYTDTTKKPGIASNFHRYCSLVASLDYCVSKSLPQAKSISVLVQDMEQDLIRFYGRRTKDEKTTLIPKVQDNR